MRLYRATLLVLVSLGLLSGCAYIEGRKDQQMNQSASTKSSNGKVIQVNGPQPLQKTPHNPAETASKMIAPITQ